VVSNQVDKHLQPVMPETVVVTARQVATMKLLMLTLKR
jgi:hypothetical protein